MIPTTEQLAKIAGRAANDNMASIVAGLAKWKGEDGLGEPQILAHYLAQLAHESGRFRWDREIWGPTPTQKRYEGRRDLGNTQPGDGSKFRGYTSMMITGRHNTSKFEEWCRQRFGDEVPSFITNPKDMLLDPWEGLAPIWYWTTRGLSRYAAENDIEMITRRINGGLNGFADRLRCYDRSALVLLGRGPQYVRAFQAGAGLTVDGISGPRTRAALHAALGELQAAAPKNDPDPIPAAKPDERMKRIAALAEEIATLAKGA